jgi:uncharacterized protein (TIGR01244 family)
MAEPKPINDKLAVSPQPTKAELQRFAELGYRTIINNRPEGEEPGQLSAAEAQAEAERLGMRYVHIPVKLATLSKADVEGFRQAVEEGPRPVLAHCKSGTRSYLLWAAGQALHEDRDPRQLAAEAAGAGFNLAVLPDLVNKLKG